MKILEYSLSIPYQSIHFLYINLYRTVEVPIRYLRVPNMGQLTNMYILEKSIKS